MAFFLSFMKKLCLQSVAHGSSCVEASHTFLILHMRYHGGFIGKVQLDVSVIQVRGVTLFSRQFQSVPGETWLPTEVKVGVSPAPKGIFSSRLEIQQFFFFFYPL